MSLPQIESLVSTSWAQVPELSAQTLEHGVAQALEQLEASLSYFGTESFPTPASFGNVYRQMDNTEWTNGFWTGCLWLAWELSRDDRFRDAALAHVASFAHRVDELIELDHHDLGFLYTPSCVAAYKLTGDTTAKRAALAAADQLMTRWRERGQFIQAWGPMTSRDHYRLIIDCLLNVPLLYWASEETGNELYAQRAAAHFETTCNTIIRQDGSAFHTFYMDPETGKPSHGATRQGYSDSSAWARGQAWGIYGIPLNLRYNHKTGYLHHFEAMRNYFLNRLPQDAVCMWDLIFTDADDQPRDSSAAAIAACGLQDMSHSVLLNEADRAVCRGAADAMLDSLIRRYTPDQIVPGQPLVLHGVYSWHSGKGVDEGNIWGDYFYLEALVRKTREMAGQSWQLYW